MSDDTAQDSGTLAQALALGARGYKVIPIPVGEKFPRGLQRWQELATDDETTILDWWGQGERGIGWAMGHQPNGSNLAAIDVDVTDGKQGKETFKAIVEQLDVGHLMRHTVASRTGSGGMHFIVDVGEAEITNGRLGDGLDLRGEGGFIVIPPSIHPNGTAYHWLTDRGPTEIEPLPAPKNLIKVLLGPAAPAGQGEGAEPESLERASAPSSPKEVSHELDTGKSSPADWVRANISIESMLDESGWTYIETRGDDSYWCRPGKNPRDGHSAILHEDAPLVVWSTEAPEAFLQVGRRNSDGSISLSPLEVYAAVRHGGDVSVASTAIRRRIEFWNDEQQSAPSEGDNEGADAVGGNPMATNQNLADDFWASEPWLEHVRQAAHSRLVSPDALLMSILARYAVLVPPNLRLPPIIGSEATFDFIGCAVASSSGGKSIANHVAAELLPIHRKDLFVDLPVGSGEGLIQSFMVPEQDDDGKPTGKQVVGMTGIHFTVDEGTALMEQNSRKGTTIIQTLCSAWSGSTLGQANASAETRRIIEARRVRVSAMINIQTASGHLLLDDQQVAVGLPQRVAFVSAHDATIPENRPTWPGPLTVDVPDTIAGTQHLEVAPEIAQELIDRRRAVVTGELVLGPLDGHQGLLQLKLAGLLTLIRGGTLISVNDWDLASRIVGTSKSVRLLVEHAKQDADRRRQGVRAAQRAREDMAAEQHKIEHMAQRIASRASVDGVARGQMRKALCRGENRHLFDAALAHAVDSGWVVVEDRGRGKFIFANK